MVSLFLVGTTKAGANYEWYTVRAAPTGTTCSFLGVPYGRYYEYPLKTIFFQFRIELSDLNGKRIDSEYWISVFV